jgi:hypothetical protein
MNNRQFVIVIVITFIVIIIWIIADILHTQPSVEINPKLTTLLTPINPNFDQKVVAQIKEITPVNELELEKTSLPRSSSTPSASPIITPLPLPIPSAIVASVSATTGGSQ